MGDSLAKSLSDAAGSLDSSVLYLTMSEDCPVRLFAHFRCKLERLQEYRNGGMEAGQNYSAVFGLSAISLTYEYLKAGQTVSRLRNPAIRLLKATLLLIFDPW